MAAIIRVFLVDDHEVVRRGLADLLGAQPDIDIVGEAGSAAQARSRIAATRPDVAVLDVRLPDGSGIDVCRAIQATQPETRCLILTAYDDDQALYAAVIAGAAGYVLKDVRGANLIEAVRAVAAGHSLLDPALKERARESMKSESQRDPRLAGLSLRERQVLALIADGLTKPGNRRIHGAGRKDGQELRLRATQQTGPSTQNPSRGLSTRGPRSLSARPGIPARASSPGGVLPDDDIRAAIDEDDLPATGAHSLRSPTRPAGRRRTSVRRCHPAASARVW